MNIHTFVAVLHKLELVTKEEAEKLIKELTSGVQPSNLESALKKLEGIIERKERPTYEQLEQQAYAKKNVS